MCVNSIRQIKDLQTRGGQVNVNVYAKIQTRIHSCYLYACFMHGCMGVCVNSIRKIKELYEAV